MTLTNHSPIITADSVSDGFAHARFDNSYAMLPEACYARQNPVPVTEPQLLKLNTSLARDLRLDPDGLASPQGVAVLAGNAVPDGAEPLAMAYAGHQFGHFSPQLGDGRAILLGELIDTQGARRDVHLKGSGRTPFSRRGDGRASLGPVIREYILSEAMHALGIPTTRSLAMVTTGERVMRETALPGGVLTRIASSHLRIGSCEYLAARGEEASLQALVEHCIGRHYPEAAEADDPHLALLRGVMRRQSQLIAQWMGVGFIHGVMNTDNMALSGETIDYGPCAFMDEYAPDTVFSSIDTHGRYAYGNQPVIAQWNLARFAESLLPVVPASRREAFIAASEEALEGFATLFRRDWLDVMRAKLGLHTAREGDEQLVADFLSLLHQEQADFTLSFRGLSALAGNEDDTSLAELVGGNAGHQSWRERWQTRCAEEKGIGVEKRRDAMYHTNPLYIPRNYLVEQAIEAAVHEGDLSKTEALLALVTRPFNDQDGAERYTLPPQPQERVYQTFCGT